MKPGKKALTIMALAAALLLSAACGSEGQKNKTDGVIGENGSQETAASSGGGGLQEPGADGEAKLPQGAGNLAEESGQEMSVDFTVEEAYNTILENCTQEFIGGYLVNESFLSWITRDFGEDVVFALAEAVKEGEQDSELWYEHTGSSIHVLWDTYCKETGFQSYRLERVCWKECASKEQIVLDFIGDINFAEDWSTTRYLDKQIDGIFDCFSQPLMEELQSADIMMVNNEFVYSTGGEPLEGKAYTFRAHPDRVYLLELMGADIVSLANNHAYDYGPEALVDTFETLEEAGMPYVGAGRNLDEAMKPSYFIANGRKIAIVSATQIERSTNYTREATKETPGVLKTLNPDKFVRVIEEAQKNADYVIAYVHWGTEHTSYFEADQEALADAFIEAGADAIIGGHTHSLQGFQYRDGVPIIYSLGNFWFNSNKLDTGIAQLVIHKDGKMDMRFLPCVQKKNETYLVEEEEEKQRILRDMEAFSAGVTIDDEGYVIPNE